VYGSCGYVSLIQYLSYYDTFFNDNIIPESYERNQGNANTLNEALSISPGVLGSLYSGLGEYNKETFRTYIENNKSTDFQMYLMYVYNQTDNWAKEKLYSIGMQSYQTVLDSLFVNLEVEFSYTEVEDFGATAKPTDQNVINWFDAYVKGQLDLGNPVILHIAMYREENGKGIYGGYHSVVAYYYDLNGIHANFGWEVTDTDKIIGPEYQITEAGIIDFSNLNTVHSDNYIVNNNTYCGCGHTHAYELNYTSVNNSLHSISCSCGDTITESHNSTAVYENERLHTVSCSECDYSATRPHTFYITDLTYCIECHAYITAPGIGGIVHPGWVAQMVTANGSYILPNGCIVLVLEDVEAYYSGTLVFYDASNPPQTA